MVHFVNFTLVIANVQIPWLVSAQIGAEGLAPAPTGLAYEADNINLITSL